MDDAAVPIPPSAFKGPKGPLLHRCAHCAATGPKLLRCNACRAVRYCSREHEDAHRSQHEPACTRIQKARTVLAAEERQVHAMISYREEVPKTNLFETERGYFWTLRCTRPYMRARYGLVNKHLLPQGTLDAVAESLEHFRDMLSLCRKDDMGVRFAVPGLMLRLDLDQECYDFVKWWAKTQADYEYDWDDVSLPYLDVHGADIFDDNEPALSGIPDLQYLFHTLLLKLKLLVDIRNLKVSRKILAARRIPYDIQHLVETFVIRSPLSVKLQMTSPASLSETEDKLLNHIRRLAAAIAAANIYLAASLFDPDEALAEPPRYDISYSFEGVKLAMRDSYAALWETEGALELLADARACAARGSGVQIEPLVQPLSKRTREQLLGDVSVTRMWEYLGLALEDASYLGPPSERPSNQHVPGAALK